VRRRVTWAAGLLAAASALVLATTATAQESGATLTEVGSPRFPERAFVLTLPEAARLDPSTVRVLENGKPVSDLTVVPASAAGADEFGVVLVIDASNSMRGAAIEGAMEAARSFAAHRNPQQQLAVVTFGGGETDVLLPFTADADRIAAALGETPELRRGTPLYDGVVKGAELLENAQMTAGSLVVLTDGTDSGADEGSVATLEQATAAAQKAHARVFTVGLRSRAFNASTLKKMAHQGGGAYAEATSAESLLTVYDKLGAQLAVQHLIRYRSLAGPGVKVQVEVLIEGREGSATASYVTPTLPTKESPPYHDSLNATLWQSPVTMVVASLLAAGLVMGAFLVVFNRRKATLRSRMAGFVSLPADEEKRRRTFLTGKMLASAEKSLERTKWWARFKEELEIAQIQVSAVSIVVVTGAVTAVVMWVLYGLGGLLFAPIALFIPFTVRWFIKRKLARRRRQFAEQLPDNLQVLSSALRAGHSFVGALSVVVDDSPPPSREEFRRVVADEQLGVPLQDALDEVARRMDNRDLEQVSLVAALQRETGGNTAEVLDRVTETIRERFELRRLVKTLTAQGRMSRWVVSALPVVLLSVITLINPGYMEPLYSTGTGRGLLVASGFFVVMGSIVIGRIVNIKV
jgi:tight adherence protein B